MEALLNNNSLIEEDEYGIIRKKLIKSPSSGMFEPSIIPSSLELFQESDINGNKIPASQYRYMQDQLEKIQASMLDEGITEDDLYNKRPTLAKKEVQ